MSKHQRLHPIAILFDLITLIRHSLFAIIAGFFAFKGASLGYYILIAVAIFVLLIIFSLISWYRYTYWVEGDELRIEHGIFIRKKRYISKNRIQSIDLTAGVIHRVLKLVKVQVETAGSGDGAEASLSAVKLKEGELLRGALKSVKIDEIETNEEAPEIKNPFYQISFKRLFLAGSTSGSIGIILAIAAFGFSELEQFIPENIYDNSLAWIVSLSIALIIGLVICILIILWLFGIAGTMIKYGNFTITKNKEELFITRGLLEKKQLTIPLKRIQAIGIKQSVIRQPLGYVSVFAVVAGGSTDKGEDFPVLFPIMKAKEVEKFLQMLLPKYAESPEDLNPLPKRARKFYLMRSSIIAILLLAGVVYFYPQFSWVPIVLLLGSIFLGVLRHKDGGYHLESERLIIRYRVLSKMTMIMYHKRIQAFEKKQHKIQMMQNLATVRLSVIGSQGTGTHYTIKDQGNDDADRLADWYSYRT